MNITTTNQTFNPNGKKPKTPQISPGSSVENRISGLMDPNRDINKRLKVQAMNSSAQRGLQSSSIAQEGAMNAMFNHAMPIAQQDAAQSFQMDLDNKQHKDKVGLMNLESSNRMKENKFSTDQSLRLQDDSQAFESGERKLDRDLQTSLQNNQQNFQASQNQLDRNQQTTLQDDQQAFAGSESAKDRDFQSTLESSRQKHDLNMLDLSTAGQLQLQNDQQAFQGEQAQKDRVFAKELEDLKFKQSLGLLDAEGQQRLRELEAQTNSSLRLQNDAQTHQSSESALDRQSQERQAELDRDLTKELENLRYANSLGLIDAEGKQRLQELESQQQFTAGQSALDRKQQTDIQKRDIAAQKELEDLRAQNQSGLLSQEGKQRLQELESQQEFSADQSALDRTQQTNLQKRDIAAQKELEDLRAQNQSGLLSQEGKQRLQELESQQQFAANQQEDDQQFRTEFQGQQAELEKQMEMLRAENQQGLLSQEGSQRLQELEKQHQQNSAQIERNAVIQKDRDELIQALEEKNINTQFANRFQEIEKQTLGQIAINNSTNDFQAQMEYRNSVSNAVSNAIAALGNAMANPEMDSATFGSYQRQMQQFLTQEINNFNTIYGFDVDVPDANVNPGNTGAETGTTTGTTAPGGSGSGGGYGGSYPGNPGTGTTTTPRNGNSNVSGLMSWAPGKVATKDTPVLGGQWTIKAGETMADFEKRMNSSGKGINPDVFAEMFAKAGAFN